MKTYTIQATDKAVINVPGYEQFNSIVFNLHVIEILLLCLIVLVGIGINK